MYSMHNKKLKSYNVFCMFQCPTYLKQDTIGWAQTRLYIKGWEYSEDLKNDLSSNRTIEFVVFYLSLIQMSCIQMVVQYSNGTQILDYLAIGQLLTIWIPDL